MRRKELKKDEREECLNTPVDCVGGGIYVGGEDYILDLLRDQVLTGYPEEFQPALIVTLASTLKGREEEYQRLFNELGIKHLYVPTEDSEEAFQKFLERFPEILKAFYEAFLANKQILIHCQGGMVRAPTVTCMCISKLLKVPFKTAHQLVQAQRPKTQDLGKGRFMSLAERWIDGEMK